MKRWALISLLLGVVLLGLAESTFARGRGGRAHHGHFHGRVFVGVGPSFWWGPYPYWYYPYYYPPPYVYAPPVVEAEPVYIERSGPVAPEMEESFWYFCRSANAYYPTAPSCSEAWIKVLPRP